MKILIVGATGVVGRHVIPRLLERGHEVRALVRTRDQATQLQRLDVQVYSGDILVSDTLSPAVSGAECVIHLATAIPRNLDRGDWTMNDRIRREGTRNLLVCAAESSTRRYIQQSIIMLYGDYGNTIVDESASLQPSPYIRSAFDMEQQVRESNIEWCILRGGYFYGPSTGAEDAWRELARSAKLQIPANSGAFVSLVHVIDMSRAVVAAAEEAKPGSIYNVVDDRPVSYGELYNFLARQIGAPDPEVNQIEAPSLGCSNNRIKADLGWHPLFPSFRSGLVW
ncbi:MAG: NAD(P)-dependent oxidoreductase [Spirochaetales bacterium]|nr:NAD(P)-dependent oxidoreductase [Spirochaetales bacterium]